MAYAPKLEIQNGLIQVEDTCLGKEMVTTQYKEDLVFGRERERYGP